MNYYIIDKTLNPNVIGSDYPQAYKFIKGYDPRGPHALFSIYKYWNSFPDYIPNLDGIMLSGTAKQTDFVSDGFSIGYIVSEKAKNIIEKYNLYPHCFYPLGLYIRKVKYDYFLLFMTSGYSDFVDYKKSTFEKCNLSTNEKDGVVSVDSKKKST
ncbi:hypothetical protein [uncultured Bacteroides sp.]|uniref:hypothetical protein n=1 Tax=uncultured Bacteroides sp. TaxID=162156 RepID=UPI002AAC0AB1|nr:hypothetical protein [uncultured Bacteroides sp.]